MSDILTPQKHLSLVIDDPNEHELITKVARALSVKERVMILKDILTCSKNIPTIAKELNIPESSVTRHVEVLADAGLIYIAYLPGIKGHVKFLSQAILDISVSLEPLPKDISENEYSMEMPLGMFANCDVKAPCGMTGKEREIETFDDPSVFFSPSRIDAECIWFDSGFITYRFPAKQIKNRPYLYTSKKGKAVTIKTECYYIIKRELYKRYYLGANNVSLEMFHYMKDTRNYYSDEEIEASYDRVEKIISLMNLGEKHLIVLNGRLRGDTYAQLAAILHCTTAGVQGFRLVMKKRYIKVMRTSCTI